MKKSKPTKSNQTYKILRMLSRDEQFERNGGGQFVAMNRAYKNKKKYNRKDKKKELRFDLNSFLFIPVVGNHHNLLANLIYLPHMHQYH